MTLTVDDHSLAIKSEMYGAFASASAKFHVPSSSIGSLNTSPLLGDMHASLTLIVGEHDEHGEHCEHDEHFEHGEHGRVKPLCNCDW